MEQTISLEEAKYEVNITIDRLARFYYHTVQTLISEFGEEEAKRLIVKIIADFGMDCGQVTQERVAALGKENSIENHHLGKELPVIAFQSRAVDTHDSKIKMTEVTECPYAKVWQQLGFEKWGRLYCTIDQAKYKGYNPNFVCYHDKNILDGDSSCMIRVVDTE